MLSTLHWGPFFPENGYEKTSGSVTKPTGDFSEEWHTYTFEWEKEHMTSYVDGKVVLNVKIDQSFWQRGGWDKKNFDNPWRGRPDNAPFDHPFYIILNVAVGGTNGYFPDGLGNKPWSNRSPHAVNEFYRAKDRWYPTWKGEDASLRVDYIRVYQK